jgi:phage-related protein
MNMGAALGRRPKLGIRGLIASSAMVFVFLGAAVPASATGSGTSPKKWANGICSAVQDWVNSVESTLTGLIDAGSLENASQQAISGLDTATMQLTDSIEQLGTPSTSDGRKARRAIETLSEELSGDVDNIKNELTNLPSDAAGIASSFAKIGSDLRKAISQVQSTATTLKGLSPKGELKKAFQSSSKCQSLKEQL